MSTLSSDQLFDVWYTEVENNTTDSHAVCCWIFLLKVIRLKVIRLLTILPLPAVPVLKCVITGPPNSPVLFCTLSSVASVVCRRPLSWRVGAPAAGRVDGRAADTARRALLLRPVRAIPC